MEVRVLGPLQVMDGSRVVRLGPKERKLLARLVAARGRVVPDDVLIDVLWGARPPSSAHKTLQGYVYRIRRGVGDAAVVRVNDGYALGNAVTVDLDVVEELITRARIAAADGLIEGAAAEFECARQMFRGDALRELDDDSFTVAVRRQVAELELDLEEERLLLQLEAGKHATLIGELEAVVGRDPTRERAWCLLVRALAANGRQADALEAIARARRALVIELGISPSAPLLELERSLLAQHDESGQPATHDHARPHRYGAPRVAQPRTPLIGRATELERVVALLAPGRIISVVGAGGAGKTRLALEVLIRHGDDFGGGTFVDLSSVTDPDTVAAAVADAVGMPFGSDVSIPDVVAFLSSATLLLVLDNCEQVLGAVGELCDLCLTSCRRLLVLCTSRQPISVDGEHVLRLSPLATSDAVNLFRERSKQAGASSIAQGHQALIEDICKHVDNNPLAVEIIAAQTPRFALPHIQTLVVRAVGTQLDGGSRLPERHRTLENAIGWSYDLLASQEQAVLRRLAVLPSSFAIGDVLATAGLPSELDALRIISSLVDKSLLVLDAPSGRHRLLDTVRAFAASRLTAHEADAAYTRLYDRMRHHAPGPWSCWLHTTIDAEGAADLHNVRAVIEWCTRTSRVGAAATLIAANAGPWFVTGRVSDVLQRLCLPVELDAELTLDERLATRTAATWLAVPSVDLDRWQAVDDHLQLAPPDHPARVPLLFLKAWAMIWTQRERTRQLLAQVRANSQDDTAWLRSCDLLEALSYLLDDRPDAAIDHVSADSTEADSWQSCHERLVLALACHLDGRHDVVTAIVSQLDATNRTDGFMSDLLIEFVRIVESIGRNDIHGARAHLANLATYITHRYPHMTTAPGIALHAAAAVALASGRPSDAIALLAGSRTHGLHLRYEGSYALGRRCFREARHQLNPEHVSSASALGTAMTVTDLLNLGRSVATDA